MRIQRFRALLRHACRAPASLQAEVRDLAKQLGIVRIPAVRLTKRRIPPLVWARFGEPTILLPAELLRKLTTSQRKALQMHELAHCPPARSCAAVDRIGGAAPYWWLPTAWWARRNVAQATEHCCDAEVVARLPHGSRAYAEALLATIDYLSTTPLPLPLGASGFSQFGQVSRRIEMILEPLPVRRAAWRSRLVLLVFGLAVLPLSVRTLWAEPASEPSTAATDATAAPPSETPPDSEADPAEPESAPQPSPGGKFVEGEAGKDWQFELTREQVEQQMRDLVKNTLDPVHAASERRKIAKLELQKLYKEFDAGTVTIDALLEAQRRLADAEVSFARHATALCKDEKQRKRLRLEANLLITQEALNNARRIWQKVYKLYRTGSSGGEANVEAQAREQFYQFKSQLEAVREEYRQFTAAAAGDDTSSRVSGRDAIAQAVGADAPPSGEWSRLSEMFSLTIGDRQALAQVKHAQQQLARIPPGSTNSSVSTRHTSLKPRNPPQNRAAGNANKKSRS